MNKVDEGYLYIAKEYVARNDYGYNALTYINRTLEANPNNVGAYVLMLQILQQDDSDEGNHYHNHHHHHYHHHDHNQHHYHHHCQGKDKLQRKCFETVAKFPDR